MEALHIASIRIDRRREHLSHGSSIARVLTGARLAGRPDAGPPIYLAEPTLTPPLVGPRGTVQPLHPAPRPRVSLRAAAISKVYGETVALWGIDLDCRSRELVAIQGTNGSGKTTLLLIIAGLVAASRGRLAWTTSLPELRPRIGLLGHAAQLVDELTAFENVALAARLARRDEAVATGLLEKLGVGHHAARRTGHLSAGTRRRVGLARVLATDPDVLLADEPFAGLDERSASLVAGALTEARDDGRLVLMATHDAQRRQPIATRTLRLEDGRLRSEQSVIMEVAVR